MKTLVLILAQLAASGSDAYFTDRNMHQRQFVEYDPIAKPFTHSRPAFIAASSFGCGVEIVMPRLLHKRNPRLSLLMSGTGIAASGFGAITSADRTR
jgi:hypothetical protein